MNRLIQHTGNQRTSIRSQVFANQQNGRSLWFFWFNMVNPAAMELPEEIADI
jgi:hypothetical protein